MADKKPTKKGVSIDPLGDLKWFFGLILAIFIVWYFTGGYERYLKNKEPFIKPPFPLDSGEIYGPDEKTTKDGNTIKVSTRWEATNTRYFSVSLPSDYTFTETSTSPYKAEITNGKVTLYVEYGYFVKPFNNYRSQDYNVYYEKVGGRNAKMLWPKNTNVTRTGIFFDRLIGNRLSVYGEDLTKSEQSTAFRIFRSITIK